MAELRTRTKRRNEDWPVYGESLEKLADKAYPELQEEARERFALNQYLTQLTNPQVAFGVKQSKPKTIDDAVRLTLEMESYLQPEKQEGISFIESDDNCDLETIAVTTSSPHENPLKELMRRLDEIEAELKTLKQPNTSQRDVSGRTTRGRERKPLICWNCGTALMVTSPRTALLQRNHHSREKRNPRCCEPGN